MLDVEGTKAKARLFVLACDHRLQRACPAFQDLEHQRRHENQQRLFATSLSQYFLNEEVTFVAEEIGYKDLSVAQSMAQAFRLEYCRIEMPLPERIRVRCHPDYEVLYRVNGSEADVLRCHKLREEYMCRRILEFVQEGQSGLVLCGRIHANRLGDRLAEVVASVEARSLSDQDWFDSALYGWQ